AKQDRGHRKCWQFIVRFHSNNSCQGTPAHQKSLCRRVPSLLLLQSLFRNHSTSPWRARPFLLQESSVPLLSAATFLTIENIFLFLLDRPIIFLLSLIL